LRRVLVIGLPLVAIVLALASAANSRQAQEQCFGFPPTISGSGVLVGTDGPDVIVGSDGVDVLDGKGGDDKLCGQDGADLLIGGAGDDQLDGGAGNDSLHGGDGMDFCDGGAGTNIAAIEGSCDTVTNAAPPPPPAIPVMFSVRATLHATQQRGGSGSFAAILVPTPRGTDLVWQLSLRLRGTRLTAEIRQGKRRKSGQFLVDLCNRCPRQANGLSSFSDHYTRLLILGGDAYVIVRSKQNPQGALRGQIRRATA
jgi:hypothetical protein